MLPSSDVKLKIELLIEDLEINGYTESVYEELLEYYFLLEPEHQLLMDRCSRKNN